MHFTSTRRLGERALRNVWAGLQAPASNSELKYLVTGDVLFSIGVGRSVWSTKRKYRRFGRAAKSRVTTFINDTETLCAYRDEIWSMKTSSSQEVSMIPNITRSM